MVPKERGTEENKSRGAMAANQTLVLIKYKYLVKSRADNSGLIDLIYIGLPF